MLRKISAAGIAIVVAMLLVVGLVVASSGNVVRVDGFTTGPQTISIIVPDGNAGTYVVTQSVSAPAARGGERDTVFTVTAGSNVTGSQGYYAVNTSAPPYMGVSAAANLTPSARIEWDGPDNDPNTLNPNGLGGVDFVSGTNTGFVIETNIDDLAATLIVRAYSGTNSSAYVVNLPGGVDPGSHIDYFVPFDRFTPAFNFSSVGALAWDIQGANSLDFQVSEFEADRVYDSGDLTNTYSTLESSNGPRHQVTFVRLGNNVDSEPDGQPTADALGDDLDNNAPYFPGDEDGVVRTPGIRWDLEGPSLDVVFRGPCANSPPANRCFLRGWIDFNNDGDFNDTDENVISDTITSSGGRSLLPISAPRGRSDPKRALSHLRRPRW